MNWKLFIGRTDLAEEAVRRKAWFESKVYIGETK